MTWIRSSFAAATLIIVVMSSGCAAARPESRHNVFSVVKGFTQGISATTADVVDVGIQPFGLSNVTGHSVRLLGVSLVSASPSVRLRSITAYGPGEGVGIVHGDLLKHCPSNKPYPVSDDVTPPHSSSRWNIVLALVFAKPGRYYFRDVKIVYTTNGQRGWQYENLFTTIVITEAPAGTKSAFDGCP